MPSTEASKRTVGYPGKDLAWEFGSHTYIDHDGNVYRRGTEGWVLDTTAKATPEDAIELRFQRIEKQVSAVAARQLLDDLDAEEFDGELDPPFVVYNRPPFWKLYSFHVVTAGVAATFLLVHMCGT